MELLGLQHQQSKRTMKHVHDYIVVLENVMPHDLCETILSEFSQSDEWQPSLIGNNSLNKEIRDVGNIALSHPSVIEKNKTLRTEIDQRIFNVTKLAVSQYNEKFPFSYIEEDSGYQLLRYKEGQFYAEHVDSFKATPRSISCSFALNDDYEGGEFAFFKRELKYKIPKGAALMFPSDFMYPHEIMPVTKGVRYSVITWFI